MARKTRQQPVSPATSRVLESWLTALDIAGRSRKTLALYRETVEGFIRVTDDPPIAGIDADAIRAYLLGLRETHKASSIGTRFRVLRAFLSWAEREGRIERTPTRTVQPPHAPQRVPEGFTDDELSRMLSGLNPRTVTGARDRAILLTLAGTGLRLAEVASLTRADVLQTRPGEQYIRVRGKGDKERVISLEPLVRQAIAEYLEHRPDDDPALWLGERGAMSGSAIYVRVKRWGSDAGVEDCHPHRFRNYALANWLKAGMDPAAAQRLAGHATMSQLQHYVSYNESVRANDELQRLTPLARVAWGKPKRKR